MSFNFTPSGLILVKKIPEKVEEQLLKLIDVGVEDLEEVDDSIELYVSHDKMREVAEVVRSFGYEIVSQDLVQRPKNYLVVKDVGGANKILNFLNILDEQDDVQKVFANVDIPDEILAEISHP